MQQPVIRVWSDFVCPWCYIGLTELQKLKANYAFTIDWRPFLLRPETPPEGLPLPAHVKEFHKNPDNPLTQRAKKAGLTMDFSRQLIPSTRRAHEGAEFAREHGALDAFHAAVLRRYWIDSQDLWQLETLRGAASDSGLDPEALQLAIEKGTYRPQLEQELEEARSIGVSAVPTFLVADTYAIQGAQDVAVFEQVMAKLGVPPAARIVA